MLKIFFSILLAANAALFAYQRGYLDTIFPSGREPARMQGQINADRIRIVPQGSAEAPPRNERGEGAAKPDASTLAAAASGAASASASKAQDAPAAPVAPVAAVASATGRGEPKAAEPLVCVDIGNFRSDEARRFGAQLAALSLGDKVSRRGVQDVVTHMVYIPPQGDREGAEKKAGELRRRGIEDFYIIQDNSSLRWAISLGVFKTEEGARAHLANLNQKGVRTARIGERSIASTQTVFRVKDLDAAGREALEKIKAAFPRQEMKACQAQ